MFTEVIKDLKSSIKEIYCGQVKWDINNLTPTQSIVIEKMAILLFTYDGDTQKAIDNISNSISMDELLILNTIENEK